MLAGAQRPGHGYPVHVPRQANSTTAQPTIPGLLGFHTEVGEVEPGAVAVEVHHVVRLPGVMRVAQHLRQAGERGRAEHIQVQALNLTRATADQAAGHRPEWHILPPARSADHQQHPQPVPGRLGQLGVPGRPRMGADKRPRAQRYRLIPVRIT